MLLPSLCQRPWHRLQQHSQQHIQHHLRYYCQLKHQSTYDVYWIASRRSAAHAASSSSRGMTPSTLPTPTMMATQSFSTPILPFLSRRHRALSSSDLTPRCQTRGKRTSSIVRVEDLPQGIMLPATASQPDEKSTGDTVELGSGSSPTSREDFPSGPAYPTVVMQARSNMHKFANCVLLTRVGGFYELYFEHAQEFGPLLNIKVASKKTNAGPVPMVCCQFPAHVTVYAFRCVVSTP